MSFKFEPFIPTENGVLSQEELIFFYYEIVTQNEDSKIIGCEWNQEVKDFLSAIGVVIQNCPSNQLSNQFIDNTIYYTKSNSESEVMALFRHLRNAFAHLHIQKFGNFVYLKDENAKNTTMIGKVKYEDLKNLCNILSKQLESINKNTYETI